MQRRAAARSSMSLYCWQGLARAAPAAACRPAAAEAQVAMVTAAQHAVAGAWLRFGSTPA